MQDTIGALLPDAGAPAAYFDAVSGFRDAVGARFGPRIRQRLSLRSFSLVSTVDLTIQPPALPLPLPLPPLPTVAGSLVTGASLEVTGPRTLAVTVEYTRIEGAPVPP